MKPVATRDSSRVGLKPATARSRCSRVKPVARPERNPLRIPSHPQSPSNGAFSFSQYGLLDKSQRPRLQRALSHRCHRQPPDSARAHGDPPRPPLERHGSLQPQASLVCFNDVHSGGCSPRAVPWSAHGCPLQPQISLCQPGERWAPTAAAEQRERRRAFDALPTMQLRPQLRNNQPFTKAK